MALARFQLFRRLPNSFQYSNLSYNNYQSYQKYSREINERIFTRRSIVTSSYTLSSILNQINASEVKASEVSIDSTGVRLMSTTSTAKLPRGARQVAMKVSMVSPGFVYEPYEPREKISFWKRWFTLSGWRRTKEDAILEMKSAYAITRLKKSTGYSKKLFYQHSVQLYKEINTLMANGDTTALRKAVTEKMYSTLKNELKRRDSMWSRVHWEMVEPVVSIRTLRARMIALDKDDLDKSFIQLTIEFLAKQKFEAYDSKGAVVSGDKTKEVIVNRLSSTKWSLLKIVCTPKFLEGLQLYGRAWRRIEEFVGTKTAVQIRSHAQKFFSKKMNLIDISRVKVIDISEDSVTIEVDT